MNTIHEMFAAYQSSLNVDVTLASTRKVTFNLPQFSKNYFTILCNEAKNAFKNDSTVIEIDPPIVVIGDIHGHLLDMIRIFQSFGIPPLHKYLFLGDLVDRGEFSLETVTLIFIMKCLFPDKIFVVRGNHEFESVNEQNNFVTCIERNYPKSNIYKSFLEVFSYLPLAAIIDKNTFCVHGGIGPYITSVNDIRRIERPLNTLENEIVRNTVWSDPSEIVTGFEPSPRKIGYLYGKEPLFSFLQNSNFIRILRGHSFVQTGIQKNFNDRCITIFSASNYTGSKKNPSGVYVFLEKGKEKVELFPPIEFFLRGCAKFNKINDGAEDNNENNKETISKKDQLLNGKSKINMVKSFTTINSFRNDQPRSPTRDGLPKPSYSNRCFNIIDPKLTMTTFKKKY
ncbi:Serine/threonine-protein phosphatase PP1-alpha catalytic subunit [Tritrichomonas foetus]|uniref:Serine/threonine-protein phosphatase n=1 Tax=Tritrichomonas foetus TaxID=1144522 RepID=A0A1J4K0W7_9EUKA|nr:Serine/threonine-protein phosphatase PP1-alpha catalytic subunit [Tritrichomonas foetus]|eukprot:OHT04602.1 Serine/threonine-protein phosphatase PP1-alpha catalytic subunit [Tritrichomonas foetus]